MAKHHFDTREQRQPHSGYDSLSLTWRSSPAFQKRFSNRNNMFRSPSEAGGYLPFIMSSVPVITMLCYWLFMDAATPWHDIIWRGFLIFLGVGTFIFFWDLPFAIARQDAARARKRARNARRAEAEEATPALLNEVVQLRAELKEELRLAREARERS